MAKAQRKQRTDARGICKVTIHLESATGERARGNIVRTFKIAGVSVSEAASAMLRVFTVPAPVYTLKR